MPSCMVSAHFLLSCDSDGALLAGSGPCSSSVNDGMHRMQTRGTAGGSAERNSLRASLWATDSAMVGRRVLLWRTPFFSVQKPPRIKNHKKCQRGRNGPEKSVRPAKNIENYFLRIGFIFCRGIPCMSRPQESDCQQKRKGRGDVRAMYRSDSASTSCAQILRSDSVPRFWNSGSSGRGNAGFLAEKS